MLKGALQDDAREAIESSGGGHADAGPAILIGAPWMEEGKLYNAMLLLDGGKMAGRTFKHDLPNYGVFDEKRVFAAGPAAGTVQRARRARRRAGLRGHLDRGRHRMPARDRRGDSGGAQRLALRSGQGGCAPATGGGRG